MIKDLRVHFKTVFEEYRVLKDNCGSIEDKLDRNMADTIAELEDITQIVSILTQNDIRLRKENEKTKDEISALTSAMKVMQTESDPLKTSMKDLEGKHWKGEININTVSIDFYLFLNWKFESLYTTNK